MRKYIIILYLVFHVSLLFGQAPVVSNVSFVQRTDGSLIVDIYYDLSDNDGETKKIEITASDDNGSSWDLNCTSLTGDVGSNVTLGTNKHVIWDFYADNPNISGSSFKVRVIASEVGTMTGNDGKIYKTVKIGSQWWMAENLNETQYRNGDNVDLVTNNLTWASLTTGAYCYYDNNSVAYADDYGALYNGYAVLDNRNLAPLGWHIPTDDEWKELESYLGMDSDALDIIGPRGTDEGGKLKEVGTEHWLAPNYLATDEYGFTVLPGGWRNVGDGVFDLLGNEAYFWTASETGTGSMWRRIITYDHAVIDHGGGAKSRGFSVRCVKD